MSKLSYRLIESSQVEPGSSNKWLVFLHGLLGSKSNWQSIAKKVVDARSEDTGTSWGAILVDLRMHGDSQGFAPPYTVEAAAADLDALKEEVTGKISGVVGHSLGGKVGLAWAGMQKVPFDEVWSVDAPPWKRPDKKGSLDTARLLDLMEEISYPVKSREFFVNQLKDRGISETTARWVAMNLERFQEDKRQFNLGVQMEAIRALFDDVYLRDDTATFEKPKAGRMVLIIGERSPLFSSEDIEHARALARENPQIEVHVIPGAGHWVHSEKPNEILDLLAR